MHLDISMLCKTANTQPRATVAVGIYTKGGDAYDCINLDYIFSQELELRGQAAIKRKTNTSRLPNRTFDPEKLKPGIAWQVE